MPVVREYWVYPGVYEAICGFGYCDVSTKVDVRVWGICDYACDLDVTMYSHDSDDISLYIL